MNQELITVIGGGTMGSGIAQVFAQSGYQVILLERDLEALARPQKIIRRSLDKLEQKDRLGGQSADEVYARISWETEYAKAKESCLAIEAVFEDLEVKRGALLEVEKHLDSKAVIGSNTSSISITELAQNLEHPERFLGVHFMNPVPLMKLVEVIQGQKTSDEAMKTVLDVCGRLQKTAVEVQDYPGFIANRILMPMINEAVFSLMEGVASVEAIDTVMKLGMNHPMGPLKLADLIGLDVCLSIMRVLHEGLGDKYRPCPLLCRKVAAGELGRKTGQGFYSYDQKT